jgi:hypothetical protein
MNGFNALTNKVVLFIMGIAFIVFWIFLAPNFMPIIRTVFQATQNITYAANSTSSNMTALENLYVGGLPIIFIILPIGTMIVIMFFMFKSKNPYENYEG